MFREAIRRALRAESLALLESMAVAKEEGEREKDTDERQETF